MRADVPSAEIDEVLYGNTRQAGNGPNPGRTATLFAGIPTFVHSTTVNNACPSSMKATILAAQMMCLEEAKITLVGGMESMSTIPYLLKGTRWEGFRMGDKVWETELFPKGKMMASHHDRVHADGGILTAKLALSWLWVLSVS